jgi:gluconokinase
MAWAVAATVGQMNRDGVVLALDVGTSSCRASLYDVRGRALSDRIAQIAYAPRTTADGGAELDPEHLFLHVCSAIDQVLSEHDSRAAPILAVATSTFWHTLLGLDADSRPLTPIYPWLDARSRADAAGLRTRLDERAVHARTGCVLHWSYWPAKLTWLRRIRPELFDRVDRWASFGELLLERLTGQRAVSVGMASGTGLLDQHTCDWDAVMLEAVGLQPNRLSSLVALTSTAQSTRATARRWPALAEARWLAALGDGACSNVGAGCTNGEHFAVMIGTSGAERVVASPPGAFVIPWGTWGYRIDERRLIMGGALNDGGALFSWLREGLQLPSIAAAERAMVAMQPDSHGLTVLPFWGGERSPGWADDARGAIVGLRLHTRPVEILRACLEAVAYRFGEIDQRLLASVPQVGDAVATGGALLRSPTWMHILADVLGRPLLASAVAEASSRGAALLALETLGALDRPLERWRPSGRKRFEPNEAHHQLYQAAAERQRHLYDALIS